MIRIQYTITPIMHSVDLRAAANECNKQLAEAGETFSFEAANAQLNECRDSLRQHLKIDSEKVIDVYTVEADRDTGEWLGDPEFSCIESVDGWNKKTDTDAIHFDTYEAEGETRAIEVTWA